MKDTSFSHGILIQGVVYESTYDIICQYKKLFPDAEIVFSTWNDQDVENFPCKVIKSKPPPFPSGFKLPHNHQIQGTLLGLKNIKSDIILKCRSEHFIHNSKIFEIFENYCPKNKIMIPDAGTYVEIEYRTSDLCQISTRELLLEFWNSIPEYDGSFNTDGGTYFTKNFILNAKKDKKPWKEILRKYFFIKSYHNDFQAEWLRINNSLEYQKIFYDSFFQCAEIDSNKDF